MKTWVFNLCIAAGVIGIMLLIFSSNALNQQSAVLDSEKNRLVSAEETLEQRESQIDSNLQQLDRLRTDPVEVGDTALDTVQSFIDLVEENQMLPMQERVEILQNEGSDYALERVIDANELGHVIIPEEYDLVLNTARAQNMGVMLIDTTEDGSRHIEFEYDGVAESISNINAYNIRG